MTSSALALRLNRPPAGRVRHAFCALAIVGCVPYLLLKLAWLSGSRVGIPEDSVLLEGDGTALYAVNALTLVMDALVILLALALVRPWGRRLPATPLLLPLWVATGLLAPMVVGVPAQALLSLFTSGSSSGGSSGGGGGGGDEAPFLEGWVSQLVYGSFTVQGVALGVLLVGYVRDRWDHALRGRVRDLPAPTDRPIRVLSGLAVGIATVPAVVHLLWAAGTNWGLSTEIAERMDAALRLNEVAHTLFALATIAALALLVFQIRTTVRLRTAVLLGWIGGATLASWGGWWLLMALTARGGGQLVRDTTALQWLTYSAQMTAGLLVFAVSVLLARRYLGGARQAGARPVDEFAGQR